MGRCLGIAPWNNSDMGVVIGTAYVRKCTNYLIFVILGQLKNPSSSTERIHVDGMIVCKNQRPHVDVMEV